MDLFIAAIRAERCIWDPQHPEYQKTFLREAAWQRIVKKCKNASIPNVVAARTKWRKLRDNHREALKRAKLGRNKLLPAQITTWKYAKAMQFLEPFMKYRVTESIESIETDVINHEGKNMKIIEPDVSTSQSVEPLEEATTKSDLEGDALDSFFRSMLKSTRAMPLSMQTKVKKKIFAAIIEAEEQLMVSDHSDNFENAYDDSDTVTHIKTEIFTEDSVDFT